MPRADAAHRRSRIAVAVAAALYGVALGRCPAALADPASPGESTGPVLQEVIVTATKRAENLQDIPETVEALSAADIQNLGITHFEDIVRTMPTVSYQSIGPTDQMFYMRGVSDGSSANASNISTTGYFLDDASTSYYGYIPDLHMYDVERIEVLDGPQGTLFGAGAMSGAIRVITNKPDVNTFSAGTDAGLRWHGSRRQQRHGRGVRQHADHPGHHGPAAFRLRRPPRRLRRQRARDQGLGEWRRRDRRAVGTQRLQHGEGVRGARRDHAEGRGFLDGNPDGQLPERQDTNGCWCQDPDRYP